MVNVNYLVMTGNIVFYFLVNLIYCSFMYSTSIQNDVF